MQIITRDRIVYSFSRDHRPVQEVDPRDKTRVVAAPLEF